MNSFLHFLASLFSIFTIHHSMPAIKPVITPMPIKSVSSQPVITLPVKIAPKAKPSISAAHISAADVNASSTPDEIANQINQTDTQQIVDEGKINNLDGRITNLENTSTIPTQLSGIVPNVETNITSTSTLNTKIYTPIAPPPNSTSGDLLIPGPPDPNKLNP